jgi:hypothetical protein
MVFIESSLLRINSLEHGQRPMDYVLLEMRAPSRDAQQVGPAIVEIMAPASPGVPHLKAIGLQECVQVLKSYVLRAPFDLLTPSLTRADDESPAGMIPYIIS